jgi:sugar phosphate isomerase/epimerase
MFSYQLYSSRNFPPLATTLRMLDDAGYAGVEPYAGLYADDAGLAALTEGLAATGLTVATGHFALEMLEQSPDRAIAIARRLGMQRLYCPYLMPDDRPTDAGGWRAFGARLQAAGAPVRAAGLGFGWHNHDFEFVALPDGTIPQVALFEGGPTLEWEMDVAWVIRGGADPLVWIDRYKDRITSAHIKDIAPAGQNTDQDGWSDVGDGIVDWAACLAALRAAGCRNFILEHDNPSDDKRFAARSLAAVQAM